jgi:hypothetical protein
MHARAGCSSGAAQLPPRATAAHQGRRRQRARAVRAGKGYFSEADPNVGLTPLWGQQPKRDLVTQARPCVLGCACVRCACALLAPRLCEPACVRGRRASPSACAGC